MRAQIDRAEHLRIPITHLDSHMGTLFARPDYFERFVKLGIEKAIPVLIVSPSAAHLSASERQLGTLLENWVEQVWNGQLKPGVTEILFHASKPSEEFPVVTASSEARGADLRALMDPRVKRAIQDRGIILTTWRELKERRQKAPARR